MAEASSFMGVNFFISLWRLLGVELLHSGVNPRLTL